MPTQQPTKYASDQRAFHDAVAADDWHTYNWERRAVRERYDAERIFRLTGPVKTILQVGCGIGSQDPILASFSFVERVDGIDPSPVCVEKANKNFPHPKVSRWVSGFEDLASNHAYDLTLSVDVFEHIDQPDRFIDKMKGIVRPGGFVVVITPNWHRWQNVALRLRGKPPVILSHYHFKEYGVGDLKALGRKHGLSFVGYFGEEMYGPGLVGISQSRSIKLGRILKPLAHVIGVVFRT